MKTRIVVVTAALLLAGLPLFAASDIFLKIDTIPGESTAPGHGGWIDVESFSWGTSAVREAAAQPMAACSSHSLNFTKRMDKASSQLAQAALVGLLLPAVTVEVRGERHMLQNVMVKSVQNVNGNSGPAQAGAGPGGFDQITLNFAKLEGPMAPFHDIDIK